MIKIEYPDKKPVVRRNNDVDEVFCLIRKKWIKLNPEEWVRQNILLFLSEELKYPISLIAVEKEILIGQLKKRFDILVYNRDMQPFLIIECKEMNIKLTEGSIKQVLNYYSAIQCEYLIVTNGKDSIGYMKTDNNLMEIDQFPEM